MKLKYSFGIFALLLAAGFTSCTAEQGTEPGNDAYPKITIFQYGVSAPYNEDNDTSLRFAANTQTEAAYYLVEKSVDFEARLASVGEEGVADYIVSNGTPLAGIKGNSTDDLVLTDMYGLHTIAVVAVGNGMKTLSTTTFNGLDWEDFVSGTYYFYAALSSRLGIESAETVLQKCTTDETLYRFKDLFGEGYSMKIRLLPDYQDEDADGVYTFFRVPAFMTPLTYGSYGQIGVRDIGYWQGDDSFVTDGGYESGMYEDGSCFLYVQYFVSGGSLGYNYDYFIPNE